MDALPSRAGADRGDATGDGSRGLGLEWVEGALALCRLTPSAPIPDWASATAFSCIVRTDQELSIVVPADAVPPVEERPPGLRVEGPWRALRVAGTLAFDLVGVVVSMTRPLADAGIPVFVISTFDTDHVLVRSERAGEAGAALRSAGHTIAEKF